MIKQMSLFSKKEVPHMGIECPKCEADMDTIENFMRQDGLDHNSRTWSCPSIILTEEKRIEVTVQVCPKCTTLVQTWEKL
jgi:ssDNA-binding Zn-finger/Zn-ribbon topoisomerase 1